MSTKMSPVVPPGGAKMQVGLNYPCFSNKYGDHLLEPGMPADFDAFLTDCDGLGVKVVRVFLLCDLNQYGHVDFATHTFTPDASNVPKLVAGLLEILKALKKHESKGILSLVDFFAFNTAPSGSAGKFKMLTNPAHRKQFFDDVFEPLLKASDPFRDNIHSWELMNEPRWADEDRGPSLQPFKKLEAHVPLGDISSFLREGIARVFNWTIPSSVGHALQGDILNYPAGDLPQFHFYPAPAETVPNFVGSHAFVGEFGGRPAKAIILGEFLDADERPWPELEGKDIGDAEAGTFLRLKLLHAKGYRLAVIWPSFADAPSAVDKFSAAVKAGIRKFNKWTPP